MIKLAKGNVLRTADGRSWIVDDVIEGTAWLLDCGTLEDEWSCSAEIELIDPSQVRYPESQFTHFWQG